MRKRNYQIEGQGLIRVQMSTAKRLKSKWIMNFSVGEGAGQRLRADASGIFYLSVSNFVLMI